MVGQVAVVEAPPDTPSIFASALTDEELTTVAVSLSTNKMSDGGIAAQVLAALGKRDDVNGRARHDVDDVTLVPAWLTAHRTQQVLVLNIEHTPTANLLALAKMCSPAPCSITFAADNGYADRVMRALAPVLAERAPWPDLPSPPDRSTPSQDQAAAPPRQILPDIDFLSFYPTVKRLLPQTDFQPIHDLYVETMNRILQWIDAHGPNADLHADHVAQALCSLISEQFTDDNITVALNAACAGFFRRGWLVTVDRLALRTSMTRNPPTEVAAADWRRLRAYRDPARAATVALYLAGLTPQEIQDCTISDIAGWHADTAALIHGHAIPDIAAPYLRAQLLTAAMMPSPAESPFLPGANRRVLQDLRQAGPDLGLNLGEGFRNRQRSISSDRYDRRAFRIERLGT